MVINYILDSNAYEPFHGYSADAGFDLRLPDTYGTITLAPNSSIVINTGVHFEIPIGYVGFIKSKSGLNIKHGIASEGVIDSGFSASIVVKLYNHDPINSLTLAPGDKITQIVFLPIPQVTLNKVDSFAPTERGDNGFGSTGK